MLIIIIVVLIILVLAGVFLAGALSENATKSSPNEKENKTNDQLTR
ncbi:hypothetical protein HGA91_00405 [candidate division WWE3 bacterium]|nr:hypothetical protein [candidate division WWE3 bacterium]